ncbi:HD domain-containing protein [Ileibacterium valens]|uniref:HD domain-containing protein n=1 Tax=Ileibacterium valens TaxID=1862668 RepID=A0A1U7NHH9_9FIRM|nr:HD domain-containing protein [Ileibacterium valens]OLU39673.1 hypothetical protein BM735_07005 [Erysipelotrichaceae bacterium NYU-BL-F16]OLU39992.1 hypothetical protein BO224_06425 [Erysipelotrichaceae bacterium NYU-BL-E8]OLU41268.1 hypothetical protein BO222_03580 [Ileibacterium valens]
MNEEEKFTQYVKNYDPEDPQIALKIRHTWKVVSAAMQIAESLKLDEKTKRLVKLAALFHDIGRFEQVRRYHTFIDSISIDHAALGYEIVLSEDFLDDLSAADKKLVSIAIKDHSLFELPVYEQHDAKIQDLISRIVRDADKIDIFRVITNERTEDTSGASKEEIEMLSLSQAVKEALLNGKSILRSDRKNALDVWVSYLGFFADLNYPISWQIIDQQGYWRKPLEQMDFKNQKTKDDLKQVQRLIEVQMEQKKVLLTQTRNRQ